MIGLWYVEAMKGRAILGYFLALLAIGGLALAPMVRPAMAMPATAHCVHGSTNGPGPGRAG